MLLLDNDSKARIEGYLTRLRIALEDLPADDRDAFVERIRAEIEIDIDLDRIGTSEEATVDAAIARQGDPVTCASRLRAQIAPANGNARSDGADSGSALRPCRACKNDVSVEARTCPKCGAPFPTRTTANVTGYEWKSKTTVCGIPLVHVAFGRDRNGKMRVAKGVVAIGQFGIGAITIAQFGVGLLFGLGQFVAAPIAIGQFAAGLVAVGQVGIGVLHGLGSVSTDIFHGARAFGGHR
jgi:hypothetical protein